MPTGGPINQNQQLKALILITLLLENTEVRDTRVWLNFILMSCWTAVLKEEVIDNLPWKDKRGPSSTRWTLEHWNRLKGNVGETSERRGGVHRGFSKRIITILNWTNESLIQQNNSNNKMLVLFMQARSLAPRSSHLLKNAKFWRCQFSKLCIRKVLFFIWSHMYLNTLHWKQAKPWEKLRRQTIWTVKERKKERKHQCTAQTIWPFDPQYCMLKDRNKMYPELRKVEQTERHRNDPVSN